MFYVLNFLLGYIIFMEDTAIFIGFILLAWAFILILHRFIIKKKFLKIEFINLILILIFSTIFTVILRHDDFLWNFIYIYSSIISLFILFGMSSEKSPKKIKQEMILIFKLFIYITLVLGILGFLIAIFKTEIKDGKYTAGIYKNRLTGIYCNSNVLAFISVVSITFCNIIFKLEKDSKIHENKTPKWIFYLCMSINIISLLLSDSNASFLFIIIYTTTLIFCKFIKNKQKKYINSAFKIAISLISFCIISIIILFFIRNKFQDKTSDILRSIHSQSKTHDNLDVEEDLSKNEIGRENYDMTSGRIFLLKQGIKLFLKFPVFGTSRGNLKKYCLEYLNEDLIYHDLHNGYLTVLVAWGLVGFIIFIYFIIRILFKMCHFLFKINNNYKYRIFDNFFAFIIAYGVYAIFEITFFSDISIVCGLFWLILGYAMSCMSYYKSEQKFLKNRR